MSFIVETGAGVPGATSYVTEDEADTFFEDRNDTVWTTVTSLNKEAALVRAADYMQQKYRLRWAGARMSAFQSLDWPRRGVPVPDFFDPFYTNHFVPYAFQNTTFIDTAMIPNEVKQAQMLLARAQIDASGMPTVPLQPSLSRVTKREKVGPLEVEYMTASEVGNASAAGRQTTFYWDAEKLLEPFFKTLQGTIVRN